MSAEVYNGYTNYETWNLSLWLHNEEPIYQAMMIFCPDTTSKMRSFSMGVFPNGTPDFANGKADFDKVDWEQLVRNFGVDAGSPNSV